MIDRVALLALFAWAILSPTTARAQAPGVPIYDEAHLKKSDTAAKKAAMELQKSGGLLSFEEVSKQLAKRGPCRLDLPPTGREPLPSRDLWKRARESHLRIGWIFKDHENPRWQVTFSGGYAITSDGAAVTCYHVVEPHASEMKEGWLIAATDDEKVYPVVEILAASHDTDTCILRLKADKLTALPLGIDVAPGDPVVCFSEPMGRRGYYSTSVVNRFVRRPAMPLKRKDPEPGTMPVFLEVGTDWAPGSSGAAVLDACGNAIGHVATIESVVDDQADVPQRRRSIFPGTVIIFRDAISARHVRELIREK